MIDADPRPTNTPCMPACPLKNTQDNQVQSCSLRRDISQLFVMLEITAARNWPTPYPGFGLQHNPRSCFFTSRATRCKLSWLST
eukprot:2999565-Prymnesium_polylepis.1